MEGGGTIGWKRRDGKWGMDLVKSEVDLRELIVCKWACITFFFFYEGEEWKLLIIIYNFRQELMVWKFV